MRTRLLIGATLVSLIFQCRPVLAACTLTVAGINYGTYDVFSASSLASTGSVKVSGCPSPTLASLSKGLHSTTFTTRDMIKTGGTDLLGYNLYLDAAFSMIWGDGTGGTLTWSSNGNATHTIFGKLPAGQTSVSTGSYADTVTVMINF